MIFFFFLLFNSRSFWLITFWIVNFVIACIVALLIFWKIWSEVDSSIACLISCCTWEIFADVRTTSKSLSESMYVIVASKDVVERMTMLYCCDCSSFLTEEKCWSTKTELNDRSSVAVHVFLIFSDVIVLCRVS